MPQLLQVHSDNTSIGQHRTQINIAERKDEYGRQDSSLEHGTTDLYTYRAWNRRTFKVAMR